MKKIIFCNHCGTANKKENEICSSCHQKIKMKNVLLIDYLLDQTKDDIKDNIKGSIFDKIKYLLKKYLYSTILTVTIVGSITTNIIVRNKEKIVTEKPDTSILIAQTYNNVETLFYDFEKSLQNADMTSLSNMLYETHYEKDAKRLGINIKKSDLWIAASLEVFKNGYNEMNKMILKDVVEITNRYCEPSHEKCIDISNETNKVYNYNFLTGFYKDIDGEKKWIGKYDIDIYFIEVEGKFYLLDFITQHADPVITKVHGDLSKIDYDEQIKNYI